MGGESRRDSVNGSGRSRAAVASYIVTTAAASAAAWLVVGAFWLAPAVAALMFAVWSSALVIREKLAPLVSVKLWMRRHRVDRRYEDSLLRMAKTDGNRLILRNVRYPEVTLALISAYRHDGYGNMPYAELSNLIHMVQVSSAWTLGSDVRPIIAAMYKRKARWQPALRSVVGWLEGAAMLRKEGVELDTMLAYFEQVPAADALAAMENGIPIEYAVTA